MARLTRTFLLGVCAALCVVSTATASTWRGLQPLNAEWSSPTEPPVPLAVNASGLAVAGWVGRDSTGAATNSGGVRVIERQPGAAWGPPTTLKAPDGTLSGDIELGLGDDGFGVAAWTNVSVTNTDAVAYSARSTSGTWGSLVSLAPGYDPQVAMQPDGQAVVIWNETTSVWASLIGENGVASAPASIFAPTGGTIDAIDLTRAGGVTPTVASILWHDATGLHVTVRGIVFSAGVPSATPYYCGGAAPGDFNPPAAAVTGVAPAFVFDSATVVADTVGGIVTGYATSADAGATTKVVIARCQPAVAGWEQVVNTGGQEPAPALALSSAGRAVAAWGAPGGLAVTTVNLRDGSDWTPLAIPVTFAADGAADTAQLRAAAAFDTAGNAVVAADFLRAGQLVFTSAHQLAGAATWTADSLDAQSADAEASPYAPGLVSHRRGGFIATWRNPILDRYSRTGDLDIEPPTVAASGLSVPVTAGQAVTASAAVSDNWSGFVAGSVRWDFGDGTTGSGDSVTHTYLTPGSKTVVVTALDAADNIGRTTVTVNVAAPTIAFTGASLVHATWKASRLSGKLHLVFAPPPAATLRIAITSANGSTTYLDKAVAPGEDVPLPARLLPGHYLARLSGTSGGATIVAATRPFTVPAPKEGVISNAFLTPRKNGQPRTAVAGFQSSLFAYIAFASPPKGNVQVKWFGPKGERYASSGPYRGKRLEFYYRLKTGLSHGTWRVVVRAKGHTATTLSIKLK